MITAGHIFDSKALLLLWITCVTVLAAPTMQNGTKETPAAVCTTVLPWSMVAGLDAGARYKVSVSNKICNITNCLRAIGYEPCDRPDSTGGAVQYLN